MAQTHTYLKYNLDAARVADTPYKVNSQFRSDVHE